MSTPSTDDLVTRVLFRLQDLPGYPGRTFGRKLRRRMVRKSLKQFEALLDRLGPDDVCLDLGANVGLITEQIARRGVQVHAVEPDPRNFAALSARVGHLPNVTLHQIAIGATAGSLRMYRPLADSVQPGDMASQGVTGQFRPGLSDEANAFEVRQLAFDAFVGGIGRRVALIKMDIEGAELDILSAMDAGRIRVDCDQIFVETHEKQYPDTWPTVRRLRHAFRNRTQPAVSLFWA